MTSSEIIKLSYSSGHLKFRLSSSKTYDGEFRIQPVGTSDEKLVSKEWQSEVESIPHGRGRMEYSYLHQVNKVNHRRILTGLFELGVLASGTLEDYDDHFLLHTRSEGTFNSDTSLAEGTIIDYKTTPYHHVVRKSSGTFSSTTGHKTAMNLINGVIARYDQAGVLSVFYQVEKSIINSHYVIHRNRLLLNPTSPSSPSSSSSSPSSSSSSSLLPSSSSKKTDGRPKSPKTAPAPKEIAGFFGLFSKKHADPKHADTDSPSAPLLSLQALPSPPSPSSLPALPFPLHPEQIQSIDALSDDAQRTPPQFLVPLPLKLLQLMAEHCTAPVAAVIATVKRFEAREALPGGRWLGTASYAANHMKNLQRGSIDVTTTLITGACCQHITAEKKSIVVFRGAFENGNLHGFADKSGYTNMAALHNGRATYTLAGEWRDGVMIFGTHTRCGVSRPVMRYGNTLGFVEQITKSIFSELQQQVAGQDLALKLVLQPILRKMFKWGDQGKPLVFLFAGPSGTGKTQLAKALSDVIQKIRQNKEQAGSEIIRIDMGEYQHRIDVTKFIGASPGFVGYQSGGTLTNALRKNPTAVVLFDEIEKAHTDILATLLALFDEGRMTDGHGATIVCPDAIFIMTTNLGASQLTKSLLTEIQREHHYDPSIDSSPSTSDSSASTSTSDASTSDASTSNSSTSDSSTSNSSTSNSSTSNSSTSNSSTSNSSTSTPLKSSKSNSSSSISTGDSLEIDPRELAVGRTLLQRVVVPSLLEHTGRPEFIGRITELVPFLPFSSDSMAKILALELDRWIAIASKLHQLLITKDITLAELEGIIARCVDTQIFGVRALKVELERFLVNQIFLLQSQGAAPAGSTLKIVSILTEDSLPQNRPFALGDAISVVVVHKYVAASAHSKSLDSCSNLSSETPAAQSMQECFLCNQTALCSFCAFTCHTSCIVSPPKIQLSQKCSCSCQSKKMNK